MNSIIAANSGEQDDMLAKAGEKVVYLGKGTLSIVDPVGRPDLSHEATLAVAVEDGSRIKVEGQQDAILVSQETHGYGGTLITLEGGRGADILIDHGGIRQEDWDTATASTFFEVVQPSRPAGTATNFMDGGDGDDFIITGYGSDTVKGGSGDDVIWLNAMGKYTLEGGKMVFDQNVLEGGTGADTFVVSTFAQQHLNYSFDPGGFRQHHQSTSWTEEFRDISLEITSYAPVVGDFIGFAKGMADRISGYVAPTYAGTYTPPSLQIDVPVPEQSQLITDFNPLEDVLIVDLAPDNESRLTFTAKHSAQGHGFYVSQADISTPLLDVTLNLAEIRSQIGGTAGNLSDSDLSAALMYSMERSYLYMDGNKAELAFGSNLDKGFSSDVGWLGSNKIAAFGAFGAPLIEMGGLRNVNFLTGTNGDEILAGFSTGSWAPEAPIVNDVKLFGFAGDDILMAGAGNNQLYGGTGNDTAYYNYDMNGNPRALGIEVDMAQTNTTSSGTYSSVFHGTVPDVANATTFTDHLFDIENITGSMFKDVIRGDYHANRITSGLGDDILAGRGGADTFILSGGSNTIEDFVGGEDRIQIAMQAYAGLSSGADLRFTFSASDGLTISTVAGTGIAVLENIDPTLDASAFQVGRDVQLVDADGQIHAVTGSVDVITGDPIEPMDPGSDDPGLPDPGTQGPVDGVTGIEVNSTDTHLLAREGVAERFVISYAWGRDLTIQGFDATEDVLDLTAFAHETLQPGISDHSFGTLIDLAFNDQSISLTGVLSADLGHGGLLLG
ncbi:hypothetical protein H8F24_14955 [Synechococcus sp. CBW1002]|nr:hypothetical protein H8F24_14955 [Synechococcus sp. CBW1002]